MGHARWMEKLTFFSDGYKLMPSLFCARHGGLFLKPKSELFWTSSHATFLMIFPHACHPIFNYTLLLIELAFGYLTEIQLGYRTHLKFLRPFNLLSSTLQCSHKKRLYKRVPSSFWGGRTEYAGWPTRNFFRRRCLPLLRVGGFKYMQKRNYRRNFLNKYRE